MNLQDAIAFVRERGIVLESARGPVPSLAEAIAGEPIQGNWWSHPRAREIFRITRAIRAQDTILVCRLVASKVTFVHQRLWPALVRVGCQIPPGHLAQLHERHVASGEHAIVEIPFPAWVSADVSNQARLLDEDMAWTAIRSHAPGAFDAI